jgi:hypothetical protein
MWRYIRALGHVAKVTEVALIYNVLIVGFVYTIDLHGFGFIHEVEKGWKSVTETYAATTAMANIINTFQFTF